MVPGATDSPQDGPARHVYEISKRLGKKGFNVWNVIPCACQKFTQRSIADSYMAINIPVANLRLLESALTKVDGYLGLILYYQQYVEAVNKLLGKIDRKVVLHTHGFHVVVQPRRPNRMHKRLVTIHAFGQLDALARGRSPLRASILQSLLKHVYQNADHYTTFSNRMRTIANRLYELDPDRIDVVPHGVDTNFFSSRENSEEIEDIEFRLGLNKPYRVLFLGHIGKGKGLEILLEAFRILKRRRTDTMLLLKMGIKSECLEITRLSDSLGIRDTVRVIPDRLSQADLRSLYKASNVFVNYHFLSGPSTALLEAMASGLPSVIPKQSINTDIVDPSCGIILETLKAKELADTIETLVENKSLARTLGKNAMEKMKKEYDWDRAVIPKYVAVYKNLED
jgi:glycosyltransferase involved in cell wall biosynthesis